MNLFKRLVKRLLTVPVEFECSRVRVTPLVHEACNAVSLCGRHYKIEMKDNNGEWQTLNRVKRFSFDVSADADAEFYIEYYDYDFTSSVSDSASSLKA